MPETYYTSDTHFWHGNIIRYCNRPYATAEQKVGRIPDECVLEMNESLITNWNSVVGRYDHIYHLGDFSFARNIDDSRTILSRLNGIKHLIRGNHDPDRVCQLDGWASVQDYKELKIDNKKLVLCHYAMRVWNGSHHGSLMLYGHSHGSLPGSNQSLDVGVDCWDYKPVNLEQIKAKLETLPPLTEMINNGL